MSSIQIVKKIWGSFWFKRLVEFAFCMIGIILLAYFISEILYFIFLGPKMTSIEFNPISSQLEKTKTIPSWENFISYLNAIIHPSEVQIKSSVGFFNKTYAFTDYIQGMIRPSLTLLIISIVATVFLGLFLSYIYIMLGSRVKRLLEGIAVFIESIPDLMWIYLFVLLFIWIYKTTGWRPFQVISFSEQAWVGPIVCMVIVPMFQAFRMSILFAKQELSNMYVEYAFSRGFSKSYIVIKHVLRNILKSLLNQFSLLYVFILSSLFLVENVFNIRGIMSFYLNNYLTNTQPEILCLWMILLFIPFYFIRSIFEYAVYKVLGAEIYE